MFFFLASNDCEFIRMGSESLAIASIFPIQICHSAPVTIRPQFPVHFDCTFTHSVYESSSFKHLNYLSLQGTGTLYVFCCLPICLNKNDELLLINGFGKLFAVVQHKPALLNNKAIELSQCREWPPFKLSAAYLQRSELTHILEMVPLISDSYTKNQPIFSVPHQTSW